MKQDKEIRIGGLHKGSVEGRKPEIQLPERNEILDLFSSYFHEVGHELSESYSFTNGDVLSPQESQLRTITISSQELFTLIAYLSPISKLPFIKFRMEGTIKKVADRILKVFTKGKWDPDSIELKMVNEKAMLRAISQNNPDDEIVTVKVDSDLNLKLTSSKEGRDTEIPAIAVEKACMGILTRSLDLTVTYPNITEEYKKSSYGRARGVVGRIERMSNGIIPSTIDIQNRKKE